MDNIFEILIYLIIIISFISSFFKKKKWPPKKVPGASQYEKQLESLEESKMETDASAKTRETEYDILKEFEAFFKVGESKPEPKMPVRQITQPEVPKEKPGFIPVPEDSFHKKTASEHTFVNTWDKKRTAIGKQKKTISPKIEKQAAAFEKHLKKEDTAATEIARRMRQRLKNPSSLKEYIIISELMGKPKALR